MNPNESRHPWSRLVAAARQVRDDRPEEAPYGFATRVTALAFAQQRRAASLFDRLALRAVGVACLLALGSVVLNLSQHPSADRTAPMQDQTAAEDPMAVLLDA